MGAVAPVAAGCIAVPALLALAVSRERRRRQRLRSALHELRRPVQILLMTRPNTDDDGLVRQLRRALAELDRAIDDAAPVKAPRESRTLARIAAEAAARWRYVDGVEVRVPGGRSTPVEVDPVGVGAALDNLIANALEHGSAPVRVEVAVGPGEARIEIHDGGPAAPPSADPPGGAAPGRRGHGLRIAGAIADEHDGRLIEPQATRDGTLAGLTLARNGTPGRP